jgi:hypothetical protein
MNLLKKKEGGEMPPRFLSLGTRPPEPAAAYLAIGTERNGL